MTEGTSPKSLLFPGAHLLFVVAAAIGVYSFVNVAREGESRRQCAATCLLKPNYADPKCFKAIVRFRFYADAAGATSSVEACLASNPPDVVAGLVSNLKTEIDAKLVAG